MGDTSSLITVFLCIALLIFWRRYRSMHKPIKGTGKRILWPLLFLTPGILWFFGPVHPAILQMAIAASIGVIFAIPLIFLTNYERREDGNIYTKKSAAFLITFIGIVILRYSSRQYIVGLDPQTIGLLFYVVAVSYIIPWRIACYIKFRKVWRENNNPAI
ncbi:cobalamin biosynthesis protein CbiX [Bacillus toyonensis]|uniref:CcdC family protein n=1 Tax=Bacillus cereus group TaxID=86661 RepID=UPI000BEB3FCF|nr:MULTISPECIES: cytochrome c biogenesis protein CcdC [Bacillus cereus group]MBJ7932884.1 cytochrome c biogenesis protein CcdC [Bacillus cereus group sp. N31]PEG17557.1 cobalamin biosynthesis protein CbiX [Bacillus toyonensis]PEM19619.1 cobalamin biosynthesis protein CbiX [Bacillus toyonensis]PFZ76894.1 cobalamin biosynthesis protein CbiX [Bacillus toyonensis]PGA07838.1 cobalamin biosynthesis protein CbiX [Bacillus toyonensis]